MTAQVGVVNAVFGIVGAVQYAGARPAAQVQRRADDTSMDEASLAQIYERFSPRSSPTAGGWSAAAARDATQEAFVRVLAKGPNKLLGDDALRCVYRVATNAGCALADKVLIAPCPCFGNGDAAHPARRCGVFCKTSSRRSSVKTRNVVSDALHETKIQFSFDVESPKRFRRS